MVSMDLLIRSCPKAHQQQSSRIIRTVILMNMTYGEKSRESTNIDSLEEHAHLHRGAVLAAALDQDGGGAVRNIAQESHVLHVLASPQRSATAPYIRNATQREKFTVMNLRSMSSTASVHLATRRRAVALAASSTVAKTTNALALSL